MNLPSNIQITTAQAIPTYKIKCVLKKPEFLVIEGSAYPSGVTTRQLELVVSALTLDAVLSMLTDMGLSSWQLVDWWEMFSLEPSF